MKYIIEFEDEYSMNEGGMKYHQCKQVPYWSVSHGIIKNLTPYTEPDRKDIEDEVWELADCMCRMGVKERDLCFGFQLTTEVTANLTYQEAKSKFEAWLKQKDEIHVGDELKDDGNIRAVVLDIMDEDYVSYEVFTENGIVDEWQKGIVVKTGRHFDEVAELLKKMRGDYDEVN